MESTKIGATLCENIRDDEKIRKFRESVFTILNQCATDLRDVLIALERLKDKNIAKCIENKLSCAETNVFGQFFDHNTIAIDKTNAGRFADFVLGKRPLLLGYSHLISHTADYFLYILDFFSEIVWSKLDFENSFKTTPEVQELSKEKQQTEVKEPLMWGIVDAKTYQTLYYQKKLEVLLEKKEVQDVAYNSTSILYKRCYRDMQRRLECKSVTSKKNKEDFIQLKEHFLEEIEKEKERFASTLTLAVNNEEELRKEKEKTDNALFIIIDRYDAEIGDKQDIYADLVAKQSIQAKKLDKLKRKARMQDLEYERALDTEVQWEIQDLEKQLSKLKLMIAHRFLQIFLTAYVQSWKQGNLKS